LNDERNISDSINLILGEETGEGRKGIGGRVQKRKSDEGRDWSKLLPKMKKKLAQSWPKIGPNSSPNVQQHLSLCLKFDPKIWGICKNFTSN
jgi:hypothetical protein